MAMDTMFKEIRPGAGFKTGDFVKEILAGGGTVERLVGAPLLLYYQVVQH